MEARGAADGERKTITALFADIRGSVELVEGLDPEEARSIVDPALRLMMDAVHGYEGYVAQSRGDGILALFGAPLAHEDHPRRALYAAMRMQDETKRYAEVLRREKGVTLEIRVGINTGQVVVRSIRKDDLHTDYVPIGHSINLAARLEGLATPGTIVVSDATRKLTEGYFQFHSLGAARVKGISEQVDLYEVVGIGQLRTKLEVSAKRGLVKFVGRTTEMAALEQTFENAKSGRGQIVGVVGEPGIGKSRLCHEFKLRVQSDVQILQAFAVSYGKSYPYLPLIDLLRSYFEIGVADEERKRREKVTGKVLTLDRSFEDTLPYLFALLGVLEPHSPLAQMDAQIRRQRTFEALKRLLVRESQTRPLLVLIEDLHWIDAETEAFLVALGNGLAGAKLMLLANYRPEYEQRWGRKGYVKELRLDPLEKTSAQEMLSALIGDDAELAALKKVILAKSEGTPFFIEEIVQGLFERGILKRNGKVVLTRATSGVQIPTTVEGVLASRIDRLPPEQKELLQTAAVIGREFPLDVLERVADEPESMLRSRLADLQAAEFVYEQPAAEVPQYIFKHALTRDVAYGSVLLERRRELHERAARAIESLFAGRLEERYSDLAHHYGNSSNGEKGVEYLALAGQQALQRSAHSEAILHLTAAVKLLETLPDTALRSARELTLQLGLGSALGSARGLTSPEFNDAYDRARELSRALLEPAEAFWVLMGLWVSRFARGPQAAALEIAQEILHRTAGSEEPTLIAGAHYAMGCTQFQRGEALSSRSHFERSLALERDGKANAQFRLLYSFDLGVIARAYAQYPLWVLGYPDTARKQAGEGLSIAKDLGHPHTLAWMLVAASTMHLIAHDLRAASALADSAIELSIERGFPLWLELSRMIAASILAEQASPDEGIAQVRRAIATLETAGTRVWRPFYLSFVAVGYRRAGKPEEGLRAVEECLAFAEESGEHWFDGELHRLKGELLLISPSDRRTEAEGCFRLALDIARNREMKSFELRAATSLCRLPRSGGRGDEARQALAEIYGWFTEGLDTADLKEAKALLDELS